MFTLFDSNDTRSAAWKQSMDDALNQNLAMASFKVRVNIDNEDDYLLAFDDSLRPNLPNSDPYINLEYGYDLSFLEGASKITIFGGVEGLNLTFLDAFVDENLGFMWCLPVNATWPHLPNLETLYVDAPGARTVVEGFKAIYPAVKKLDVYDFNNTLDASDFVGFDYIKIRNTYYDPDEEDGSCA